MGSIWSVRGVTHRYGDTVALADVTFDVREGVTALVGANGAGKTTAMSLLAGVFRTRVGECAPAQAGATAALMPQTFVAPGGIRVDELLHYLGWLRGIRPARRARLLPELLDGVGLVQDRHRKLAALSGGQQRRALLAATLMSDAQLLLLDEPTAGLDPEQRVRMRELVAGVAQERSVLVSTHLMEDVSAMADHVVMLDEGRVAFDGTLAELADIGAPLVAADAPISVYEAAFLSLRKASA